LSGSLRLEPELEHDALFYPELLFFESYCSKLTPESLGVWTLFWLVATGLALRNTLSAHYLLHHHHNPCRLALFLSPHPLFLWYSHEWQLLPRCAA